MGELHYRGDVRDTFIGRDMLGPDTAGNYVVVEATEYDPERDRTTAYVREVTAQDFLQGAYS